jgi:hypothetical protein
MWPDKTPVGRIPRTVLRWHPYGYRADPGHLIVDVAQGDPPAALITNRTRHEVRFKLLEEPVCEVVRVPRSGVPQRHEEWSKLDRADRRGEIPLPPDASLVLLFPDEARGVQRYEALVVGTDIEVSGGSGPDIIIER